ncbi:LacI family transcriptional regulator [bacterium]|nr:LacI family transcriptional regulator [bacterium]
MGKSPKVRMQDIADRLGVSKVSVFKAFHNSNQVSKDLKHKVYSLAKKMGYGEKRSKTILFLAMGKSEYFLNQQYLHNLDRFLDLQRGLTKRFLDDGYSLVVEKIENLQSYLSIRKSFSHCGVILYGGISRLDPIIKYLRRHSIPGVIASTLFKEEHETLEIPFVASDQEIAAYKGIKALIDLGYRKIGFVSGSSKEYLGYQKRLEGYKKALRACNIAFDKNLVFRIDLADMRNSVSAIENFYRDKKPDAIFVTSDDLAVVVMEHFKSVGIKIPKDLGIIGFDNMSFGKDCRPSLSSIDIPREKIGRKAAVVLLNIINEKNINIKGKGIYLVQGEPVLRGSTKQT